MERIKLLDVIAKAEHELMKATEAYEAEHG